MPIQISKDTDYHTPDEDDWVAVEKRYQGLERSDGHGRHGKIPRTIIWLNRYGKEFSVAASSENFLRDQKENYLYRKVQIQVAAQGRQK